VALKFQLPQFGPPKHFYLAQKVMKYLEESVSKLSSEILGITKVKREHLEEIFSVETRRVIILEFLFPKIMKHTRRMEKEAINLGSPSKKNSFSHSSTINELFNK